MLVRAEHVVMVKEKMDVVPKDQGLLLTVPLNKEEVEGPRSPNYQTLCEKNFPKHKQQVKSWKSDLCDPNHFYPGILEYY